MKKLILAMLIGIMLIGCGGKSSTEQEVVIVGTNAEYPPFEYLEGDKIVGIDADIIEELSKKTGIKFEWKNIAFDALIPSMQMGKLDMIIACMTVTEERAKNVNFSTPYLASPITIIVNEKNQGIANMDDLEGKKYGVQLGTTQEAKAQSIKDSTVISYPQPSVAILDLLANKVDAVVIDESVGSSFIQSNKGLKVLGKFQGDSKAIAVKKDKEELLAKINTALEELIKDGTIDVIMAKYEGK